VAQGKGLEFKPQHCKKKKRKKEKRKKYGTYLTSASLGDKLVTVYSPIQKDKINADDYRTCGPL
jgi:hypothetical protein